MLTTTSQQSFQDAFDILRLTRNTLHTNGVFLPDFIPPSGAYPTYHLRGQAVNFEIGKELTWLTEARAFELVDDIGQALKQIVKSAPVAEIAYCPRAP